MNPPGTISKAYLDEFYELVNSQDELPEALKANPKWGFRFIFNNNKAVTEIDEIEREILLVLSKLGVSTDTLIYKSYSIEELVLGVKHYLIAWSTMKDLMANLINTSLDLGIYENDLSFGMILRNEKIKNTNIAKICNQHSKKINVSYTDKQRNNAIHRGKLLDDEINKYRDTKNTLISKRYGLLSPDKISDEEFEQAMTKLNSELPLLVKKKKTEYTNHFKNTLQLNKELAIELAKLSVQNLGNTRI